MAMEKIYTCNICNRIGKPTDMNGFWFETNDSEPQMIAPENTDSVHICKKCQNQLSRALKKLATDYTN